MSTPAVKANKSVLLDCENQLDNRPKVDWEHDGPN